MRTTKTFLSVAVLISAMAVWTVGQTTEFTYQGNLQDGGTAANGNYDLEFRLYDAASGGNQIGTTVISKNNVAVTGGVFSVAVDFGLGLGGPNFPGADRYLDIRVRAAGGGVFTTLSPRNRINSTPYAVQSLNATNATSALQLGGVAASQYVITNDPRMTDARPPTAGSGNYVQNTTTPQAASNFNVSGDGTVGGTLRAGVLRATSSFNIGAAPVLSIAGSNNTFVGVNAGSANTGSINAFFGTSAGAANGSGSSNSFFGPFAGQSNTTGGGNSFFGRSAGANNTTGANNSFFGSFSGNANTIGIDNAFFGRSSGGANTSGSNNAFFGANSGEANSTGASNSFFGKSAGGSNTIGSSNSFFGRNAGANNTTGNNNAFYGINSGAVNSTGTGNSFFGAGSGVANSTADDNSFFGFNSGLLNSIGFSNSFFGANSGDSNTSGSTNSFFGKSAGQANTTGGSNSFFGASAGLANTTGISNSFFGMSSGTANTSGVDNSYFGTGAGSSGTTGDVNSFFGRSAGALNNGNNNSFFGGFAGNVNSTGSSNSFFGHSAGVTNTTGTSNSFFGAGAGDSNLNGNFNAFFGRSAGAANTSGGVNVFVGRNAGERNTEGSSNVFLGANAGESNTAGNSNTAVGADSDILTGLSFATAVGAGSVASESNTVRLGRADGSDLVKTSGRIYAARGMQVGESSDTSSIFLYGFISTTGAVNAGGGLAVTGNASISGNLSKGGGSFKIDHPLDPKNKYLYHSFVESPDMMNIYNGNVETNLNGEAVVTMPAYFEALNRDFRYQLTVIGTFAQAIVAEEIKDSNFKIRTDKPGVKVSWQVTGVRKDPYAEQNRIPTEVEKPENERGTYLYPKAYEQIQQHNVETKLKDNM